MSIVSITQASKLSGKSVRTLHRHLASGRLSYVMSDSEKGIDTSELIRAYGTIMTEMADADKKQMAGHDTTKNQSKDKMVNSNDGQSQHQIELLKLELEAEKRLSNERLQIIEAKQETIDSLKTALKLLEYRQDKSGIIEPLKENNVSDYQKNGSSVDDNANTRLFGRLRKLFG
ncbi:unnamed protein product [Commensalibacter communis]|uniref:hypothetical protein n=1 Tax=Commensalibacter communis TaxID=2972786 RepID=UPI0022FFA37C|nr:hypothetical protein [Commensalibacter communis]CAI3960869.1 unnamed protein product [Commensalibacter communis]CAI3961733.1 unnamed protein product [Commensalibacter communis]